METKTEKLLCRRVFVLDIDENLVSIQFTKNDAHNLSKSAEHSLSLSQSGIVEQLELIPGFLIHKATAFRRHEWKAFFEEIISINERYQKHANDKVPLISIIFITNASYTAKEFINNVFKPFFGEKITHHFVPDLSGFYNRSNQLQENKRLDKSDYMDYLFPQLQSRFKLSHRSQIILIDDSELNVYGAREHGFSAIHHPSNPTQRPAFLTFTTHGVNIFEQMHQKIKEAEDFVHALETQKNTGSLKGAVT